MEAKDLIAKTRVALAPEKYNPDEKFIQVGYVLSPPEENLFGKTTCYVKWDSKYSWQKSNPEEMDIVQLIPEADANALWSKLETEYKEAEEQIKSKIDMSILMLKEAQKIASEAKLSLPEFAEATYPFRKTVEECSWAVEWY